MAKICKVCGVELIHEKGVCSSCTEFFKSKYGKKYKKRLASFLKALEEFSTKLLEDKK